MADTSPTTGPEKRRRRAKIVVVARVVAGFVIIIVGLILALPGVPGPGLAIAVLGLALLADHFTWARRALDWGKAKVEQARERVRNRRASPRA